VNHPGPLLAAYPIGMGISLIYLGEHYLIDILLGWAYAAVTVYVVDWAFERRAQRRAHSVHTEAPADLAAKAPSAAKPAGVSR
jgi:membrane-associated phospholipid phosphatase